MRNAIIFLFICLLFIQCDNGYQSLQQEPEIAMAERDFANESSRSFQQSSKETAYQEANSQEDQVPEENQKIIKTGRITIEVQSYQKARIAIDTLISKFKGKVTQENENRSTYRLTNTLVIRLQPDLFDAFVHSIGPHALNIEQKNITARDVTKEFIDLETRLRNKKSVVTRYRELLKKAISVKDILEIEEALRKITEEIESTEGQLKYLRDQVNLSTLYLTYYEQLDETVRQKKGFFAQIGDALVAGWRGLQALIIELISLWHILLFLAILAWGLRWFWRRKKHPKSPTADQQ